MHGISPKSGTATGRSDFKLSLPVAVPWRCAVGLVTRRMPMCFGRPHRTRVGCGYGGLAGARNCTDIPVHRRHRGAGTVSDCAGIAGPEYLAQPYSNPGYREALRHSDIGCFLWSPCLIIVSYLYRSDSQVFALYGSPERKNLASPQGLVVARHLTKKRNRVAKTALSQVAAGDEVKLTVSESRSSCCKCHIFA